MQIEIKADKPLLTLLERIANALERYTDTPDQKVETPKPAAIEAVKPEPVETAEPVAAEPVADQPEKVKQTVTLEEIRKKVVQLSAQGPKSKEAVRDIVTQYGRNVSAIPADKYVLVMDQLNAVKEV